MNSVCAISVTGSHGSPATVTRATSQPPRHGARQGGQQPWHPAPGHALKAVRLHLLDQRSRSAAPAGRLQTIGAQILFAEHMGQALAMSGRACRRIAGELVDMFGARPAQHLGRGPWRLRLAIAGPSPGRRGHIPRDAITSLMASAWVTCSSRYWARESSAALIPWASNSASARANITRCAANAATGAGGARQHGTPGRGGHAAHIGGQHVAAAPHGLDDLRIAAVHLDLAAQAADLIVHRAVEEMRLAPLHHVEQAVAVEHPGVFEGHQQAEFHRGDRHDGPSGSISRRLSGSRRQLSNMKSSLW
jgi:hypothetical protein